MDRAFDFIANSRDGVFAVDPRHSIVLWNEGAAEILGYRPREVLGKKCYRILQGRDADGCAVCHRDCDAFRLARRRENPPTVDLASRTKRGDEVWLNVSTVLVPAARRELSVLIHLFREVTREHQLQQAAAEFAGLVSETTATETGRAAPRETSSCVRLTRREREILALLVSGVSTDAIAERLSISPRTVRNHVGNILGKLGVHSRLEAVAYSIRNGLC